MPRSWTKTVTVLKGCFNLSPWCQGDFHKKPGLLLFSNAIAFNWPNIHPTTTFREALQNQEKGFQSMTTTKLRTALVRSSEVTISLPPCLFPLPEYSARYCYDLDLGWWPKVNTNSLENEQNKIVKSIFQKHEAAGSVPLVPKKLSPCHPHQGLGLLQNT